MRAIQYETYGGPEVLQQVERSVPAPGPHEVQVQVRAAAVNAADCRLMRADPFLARFGNGLLRPKRWPVLGSDVAGVVTRVGDAVTRFQEGDAVFGNCFQDHMGAFAEYVCVREGALAAVPDGLSFAEAAAVPLAGLTAWQGLRLGAVGEGDDVLIQGAGGGVGLFTVQLAKALGARVTAVCSARSALLAHEAGADRVLDYAREDFAEEPLRYDAIMGVNGHRSPSLYKRCLKPGGRYVMIGGANRQIFEALLLAPWVFLGSGRTAHVLDLDADRIPEDLATLRGLLTRGLLLPVIDRAFPLEETAEALRYAERGHVQGKIVITP